jgi:hypothetical protein
MRAVDMIIGALRQAGFTGKEAAVVYRAFGDFALFWSGGEAAFLALDEKAQQKDKDAWTRAYLIADRAVYPSIWRVREELPEVKDDDIFETILSLVLDGIMARAPFPCACGAHATADTADRGEQSPRIRSEIQKLLSERSRGSAPIRARVAHTGDYLRCVPVRSNEACRRQG